MIALLTLTICIAAVASTLLIRRRLHSRSDGLRLLVYGKPGVGKAFLLPVERMEWFSVSEFERGWRSLLPTRISNVLLSPPWTPGRCGTAPAPVVLIAGGVVSTDVACWGTKVPPRIIVLGGYPKVTS
jgi:hypothetical protein